MWVGQTIADYAAVNFKLKLGLTNTLCNFFLLFCIIFGSGSQSFSTFLCYNKICYKCPNNTWKLKTMRYKKHATKLIYVYSDFFKIWLTFSICSSWLVSGSGPYRHFLIWILDPARQIQNSGPKTLILYYKEKQYVAFITNL